MMNEKITIKIGDKEYSLDEARALYEALGELFGEPAPTEQHHHHYEEKRIVIERPQYPYTAPYRPWWGIIPPSDQPFTVGDSTGSSSVIVYRTDKTPHITYTTDGLRKARRTDTFCSKAFQDKNTA
jgi:hypothetical protein